jgi:hypothetical protein
MPEAQRRHRALLTARRRAMQKEDGVELFKDLSFISFCCKDILVTTSFR